MTLADPVSTYIVAKDENRPELMERAFAPDAELEVVVKTDAISFPPLTRGLASITEILVTRFNEGKENVRTFCISRPPGPAEASFSCAWLVGFSERGTGAVRVGCGRYEWSFALANPRLAERLRITIERMEVLPAEDLQAVMAWLTALPHPWCPGLAAARGAPPLGKLEQVVRYLDLAASGSQ